MSLRVELVSDLGVIDPPAWDALTGDDPVGPLASWGYIYGRTHEETQNVVDTVEGINEAGDMWSRTAERFQNLFGGHGFVTEEQQEAVRAREAAQ